MYRIATNVLLSILILKHSCHSCIYNSMFSMLFCFFPIGIHLLNTGWNFVFSLLYMYIWFVICFSSCLLIYRSTTDALSVMFGVVRLIVNNKVTCIFCSISIITLEILRWSIKYRYPYSVILAQLYHSFSAVSLYNCFSVLLFYILNIFEFFCIPSNFHLVNHIYIYMYSCPSISNYLW